MNFISRGIVLKVVFFYIKFVVESGRFSCQTKLKSNTFCILLLFSQNLQAFYEIIRVLPRGDDG